MARKRLEDAAPPRNPRKKNKPAAKPPPNAPPAAEASAAKTEPRFEVVELDRVNPAPYNPRKDLQPGDPEFAKLCRSIDEFGCAQVLVFNERTGHLVGGHQTLKVLRHLGRTSAMMSVVSLSPEREKALNIALNKIQGEWDLDKLQQVMEDLEACDDPALIELTGFEDGELDKMLEAMEEEAAGGGGGDRKGGTVTVGDTFEAVAVCNSEEQQRAAYELLKENGYTAKLRTVY